jgi:hypothetical protein
MLITNTMKSQLSNLLMKDLAKKRQIKPEDLITGRAASSLAGIKG